MCPLRIQAEQDVVLVWRTHEKPGKVNLPFRQIGFRFKGLHGLLVLQCKQDDWGPGTVRSCWHKDMKHCAHPFKLAGDMDALLFTTIREHDKVLAAHFKPMVRCITARRGHSSRQKEQENNCAAHSWPRVTERRDEGKKNPIAQ